MEIREIISHYVNTELNILEVTFRTIDDSEDVVRNDQIDYSIVQEYGFDAEIDVYDLLEEAYDDEEEYDPFLIKDKTIELDEEELISFLNEYYTVNPDNLPKSQMN